MSVRKPMSAARWFVNGPSGRVEITEAEMKGIQRHCMSVEDVLMLRTQKPTPPPPRFAQPAHRAPAQMRVSMR